jgi:hypothetical protein
VLDLSDDNWGTCLKYYPNFKAPWPRLAVDFARRPSSVSMLGGHGLLAGLLSRSFKREGLRTLEMAGGAKPTGTKARG